MFLTFLKIGLFFLGVSKFFEFIPFNIWFFTELGVFCHKLYFLRILETSENLELSNVVIPLAIEPRSSPITSDRISP